MTTTRFQELIAKNEARALAPPQNHQCSHARYYRSTDSDGTCTFILDRWLCDLSRWKFTQFGISSRNFRVR